MGFFGGKPTQTQTQKGLWFCFKSKEEIPFFIFSPVLYLFARALIQNECKLIKSHKMNKESIEEVWSKYGGDED